MVHYLPATRETWVWSLGWEELLKKRMTTYSSILAWRIPWTEEPGELQPIYIYIHIYTYTYIYCCCCCSVTKLCPTLCNPTDCSMPSSSVLQYLPEFAQTHVHWVSHAIQPPQPLLPPSFAFNLSQHQGLSNESALHIRWLNYQSRSFSISPSNR